MNTLAAPLPVVPHLGRPVPPLVVPRVGGIELDHLLATSLQSRPSESLAFNLNQSWLPEPEPALRPGRVWLTATDDALLVCADLTDECVRTFAHVDHQPIWELGDAFEIFLQPAGCASYFEFQIAPNGCVLQLRYPRDGDPRKYGIESYIVRARRLIDFRIHKFEGGWCVSLRIPVAPLLAFSLEPLGELWRVAFCRYDYDMSGNFSLSSSAHLTRPDFHRIQEWNSIHVPGGFHPARAATT